MKQTIYIDVLVVLNIFVNYFLLLETSFLSKEKTKRIRLLLSSILGGVYSLIILVPKMPLSLSIFLKILFSITIILAAFKIANLKHFFRLFAIFFAVNFIFAGIMLAIELLLKPNRLQFNNGAIYIDISALTLTFLTVICYLIVKIISKFSKRNSQENKIVDLTVEFNNKKITGKGLIDTGNSLCDSFSGKPVIVAQYNFVKDILPNELRLYIKSEDKMNVNLCDEYKRKLRLIPFNSVGGGGLLNAFKSDNVEIKTETKSIIVKSIYIAVNDANLSNGEYVAILNPELLNNNSEEIIKCHQNQSNL